MAENAALIHPKLFQYGSSVTHMENILQTVCQSQTTRQLPLEDFPIATTSHTQIDCTGLDHAGGKRNAEFKFADDALILVWVLVDQQEEAALIKALEAQFGAPSHRNAALVAFTDARIAYRRDVPELLYYSDTVAEVYQAWFDQQLGS
jgi:hypothetical protein